MSTFSRARRPLRALVSTLVLVLLAFPVAARAQPTAGPDYIIGQVPLPDANFAGVAYAGTDLYSGVGSFGPGAVSIVRVAPDGVPTTVVTGLNSIGAVSYDAVCDRLLFTDNGFDPNEVATGDTVYALPAPGSIGAPVGAATLELVPAGTLPGAANVLTLPDCSVLVSDAVGGGAGRVVHVDGGVTTDLATGFDFPAGLALTGGGELLVGEAFNTDPNNPFAFGYAVRRLDLAGNPLGDLATGLTGSFDAALDAAGDLIMSGGFDASFTSTLVRIAPDGTVTEFASGFGFTSGLSIDGPSGQIATLDFGLASVETLTPVAHLTAGGRARKDCQVEWWGGTQDVNGKGRPVSRWTCHDGAACDRDGAVDGACTFLAGACFAVTDARLPKCQSAPIEAAVLNSKKLPAVAAALQTAVDAVLPASEPVCSAPVAVTIPVGRKSQSIGIKTIVNGKRGDRDRLGLRCLAAGG